MCTWNNIIQILNARIGLHETKKSTKRWSDLSDTVGISHKYSTQNKHMIFDGSLNWILERFLLRSRVDLAYNRCLLYNVIAQMILWKTPQNPRFHVTAGLASKRSLHVQRPLHRASTYRRKFFSPLSVMLMPPYKCMVCRAKRWTNQSTNLKKASTEYIVDAFAKISRNWRPLV